MIKKLKENWFVLLAAIILIITCLMSYNAYVKKEEVFIFGFKPYITISGSMEPELEVNSLIIIKKGGFDDIEVGDIISFKKQGFNVNACHRVIEITESGFITKGDNNEYADSGYVAKENYVGKLVFRTNFTAQYYRFIQEKGMLVAIVAPLLGIFGIVWGISLIFSRNKKDSVEETEVVQKKEEAKRDKKLKKS